MKKRTLANTISAIGFIAFATAASSTFTFWGKGADGQHLETYSLNTLMADGKPLFHFRGISADSTFTGMAFSGRDINFADQTALDRPELLRIASNTMRAIKAQMAYQEGKAGEMRYYLSVHGVQDEGYDMVAGYATQTDKETASLRRKLAALEAISDKTPLEVSRKALTTAQDAMRASGFFAAANGGIWLNGRWIKTQKSGHGTMADSCGRLISGTWDSDTLTTGWRSAPEGVYHGALDRTFRASGHGRLRHADGAYYEGRWAGDKRDGFGFAVDDRRMRAGEWSGDTYRGERLNHTSERIYGIDISRYQHGRGRRYYPIHWSRLRITSLGNISKKNVNGQVDYPVSFLYIKSTEGTSIHNRHYHADYQQARRHGIPCGAYHFFSTRTDAAAQARHFIRHSQFNRGDLPPALDVEPTDRQIASIGGADELFRRIRTWMAIVRRHCGASPVLYVNQRFVNKYLNRAPDIKRDHNIWIARYGEYKPDIRLAYWQLSPDGRVSGIHGEVDINVFNGYSEQFGRFLSTQLIK